MIALRSYDTEHIPEKTHELNNANNINNTFHLTSLETIFFRIKNSAPSLKIVPLQEKEKKKGTFIPPHPPYPFSLICNFILLLGNVKTERTFRSGKGKTAVFLTWKFSFLFY